MEKKLYDFFVMFVAFLIPPSLFILIGSFELFLTSEILLQLLFNALPFGLVGILLNFFFRWMKKKKIRYGKLTKYLILGLYYLIWVILITLAIYMIYFIEPVI